MLKLVSPPPRHARAHRASAPDPAQVLCRHADDDRTIGQATQRGVAIGRRTIIDAHRCIQRVLSQHVTHGPARFSVDARAHLAKTFAGRLDAIHERLLVLSCGVELEMDRLDVLSAEVEHFIGHPAAEEETS
jgi:hypothetical protein